MNGLAGTIRGFRDGFGVRDVHAKAMEPLTDEELARKVPSVYALGAHESRSERYTYIPTINVIKGLAAEGFAVFDARQARSRDEGRREFTKHMLRFRHMDATGLGWKPEGDQPIPEIVLVNSHDGTSSYRMFGGLFRFLCFNGLVISDGYVETVSIPHKGDVIPEVIEGAYSVLNQVRGAASVRNEWGQLLLPSPERVAFAEAAHKLRFGEDEADPKTGALVEKASYIKPEELLKRRRVPDTQNDLWTIFNVVQENALKGGLHGVKPSYTDENGKYHRSRRVGTKAIGGIDQDIKLNRALWALAERMAELKKADIPQAPAVDTGNIA